MNQIQPVVDCANRVSVDKYMDVLPSARGPTIAGRSLSMIIDFWKSPASRESLVSLVLEILRNPQQSVPEAIE